MTRGNSRWKKVLLALLVGLLPLAAIDCDLEDGELEFDLDGFGWHDDCAYDCGGGYFYYEDVYYEPWYTGWF